jgi:hypothetical protein
MQRRLAGLLIAFVIGITLPVATPVQAQVHSGRITTITVNTLIAHEITEGGLGGLLGGSHDEPFFVVAWEISGADGSVNNRDGRIIKIGDMEKGEYVRDIVLWQGSLNDHEKLRLVVALMEDDESVLRDGVALTAMFILAILGGADISGETSCTGHCLNQDDFVGSFSITRSGHSTIFENQRCSRIEVDPNFSALASVMLTCDGGRYQVQISALELDLAVFDYNIVALHSRSCIDIKEVSQENGAVTHQWDCVGPQQTNQVFRIQPAGDFYNIIAVHSGKCLDLAAEESQNNGGRVQQWECIGGGWTNQLWEMRMKGGAYQIIAKNSGKCLDVSKASKKNGTLVRQWDCHGSNTNHQLWVLKEVIRTSN